MHRYANPDHTVILRASDGACIPTDPRNADFIAIGEAPIAPWAQFASLTAAQDGRLAQLSARRKVAEEAFTFNGTPIRLDEGTQGRINAAISYLSLSGAPSVRWQVARGTFATFTASTLQTIGVAAGAHIQACFANVETLSGAILAAEDVAAVEAIDLDDGWP